jgi:hypothetical protein
MINSKDGPSVTYPVSIHEVPQPLGLPRPGRRFRDMAEAYAPMNQLSPTAAILFEDHCRRCSECAPEARRAIAFVSAMKSACRRWAAGEDSHLLIGASRRAQKR